VKLKPDTILPTPEEDAAITAAALADPDNPPLTDAELAQFRPSRCQRCGKMLALTGPHVHTCTPA
jgi:hypothetical protein